MYILGIESSCDESAAAILQAEKDNLQIKSNIISSQIDIHARYGGVIPEIAAREHVLRILPVIEEALKKANIKASDLEAIAVTQGPGLITSLVAGVETAKALSLAWKKPIIPVHHIVAHIYANFIDINKKIEFPILALVVSGGHSELIYMEKHYKFEIIGQTRDDAAGEAYDKAAKMMGLDYPGGPIIARHAKEYREKVGKTDIELPRPMIGSKELDFSFSGLKTALLYRLKQDKNWKSRLDEYCFAFEEAIIDSLVKKSLKAIAKYKPKNFLLAGGVSANSALRERLKSAILEKYPQVELLVPQMSYTTDNAAMIASAGYFRYRQDGDKSFLDYKDLTAKSSLNLS